MIFSYLGKQEKKVGDFGNPGTLFAFLLWSVKKQECEKGNNDKDKKY